MEEWILEIETKNTVKRIKNPRKARVKDWVFIDVIEVMDSNGKWHHICNNASSVAWAVQTAVDKINYAINDKKTYVNVDDYI